VSAEPVEMSARAQLTALAREAAVPGGPLSGPLVPMPTVPDARPAAVLILFGVSGDLDVLLLARATTLRAHPGQIAFPGGRTEAGDDGPVATALREAQEETGLDPAGVEPLGTLGRIPLPPSRHLVTPVLAWWRQPSAVRVVDAGESADVFRAPVADLLDPATRGTVTVRRDGREFRSPGFLVAHPTGEHLVWGFTGSVLSALFDRLGWTEPWDEARELAFLVPPADPAIPSS
jgi:8-oxo-dGTP pyrophosphatase MutT (NUDIX family)